MNAEQHHSPLAGENAAGPSMVFCADQALSALADGEISAAELDRLLATLESPAEAFSNWHAYQVVGAVLRANENPTGERQAGDFLAAVRTRLETCAIEPMAVPFLAVTAAVPALGRSQAANDAEFRWKLVAGFASLAAVMAVSWNLITGSGSGSDGAAGAQLASAPPAALSVSTAQKPAATGGGAALPAAAPVVVSTGQGPVIRDAQLEALLAEHRQHGGMSALQMPSGFIRNATYEAAGR